MPWEQVLIVGITAAAGVGGAVAGGYFQSRTSKDALQAESERLDRQTAEEHFRHRQGVYNDALIAVEAYVSVLRFPQSYTRDEIHSARGSMLRRSIVRHCSEAQRSAARQVAF
jgi:hypothetical protein